jgi:hypothetical protein
MRHGQGLVSANLRLRRIPQKPERQRGIKPTASTQILPNAKHLRTALGWGVACDAFLQVLVSGRPRAKPAPRQPKGIVGDDRKGGIVSTLRQVQQHFADLSRRMELWSLNLSEFVTA